MAGPGWGAEPIVAEHVAPCISTSTHVLSDAWTAFHFTIRPRVVLSPNALKSCSFSQHKAMVCVQRIVNLVLFILDHVIQNISFRLLLENYTVQPAIAGERVKAVPRRGLEDCSPRRKTGPQNQRCSLLRKIWFDISDVLWNDDFAHKYWSITYCTQ